MRNPSVVILTALTTAFAGAAASADVVSTFDLDDEGWTVFGDAQGGSATPGWLETGGNPGGHLSADDNVAGGTWYWNAPEQFLGNQSSAYGQTLSFDLAQSSTSSPFDNDDLVLIGGGFTIAFDTPDDPGTDWTSYTVDLDDQAGWRVGSIDGELATAEQIQTVLGNLSALRIRGEYRSGSDTGRLDNVVLTQIPAPGTLALLGLGGLAIRRRRRRG